MSGESSILSIAVDRDWRVTDINQGAMAIFEKTRDELIGKLFWDVFPQGRQNEFYKAMTERVPINFEELSRIVADRWFETLACPTQEGLAIYLRDITDRKQMKQELRRANVRITEILESITDAFSAWDYDWRYIYVNERAAKLLGKSKEQLIGQSVWDLFPEAVGTEAYHKCQQAMAERVPLYFQAFYPALNKWYENYLYPTKEGLSVYWREITEGKSAEAVLRESKTQIETILQRITDEFNAFDREWCFTYVNEAALNSIRRAKGEQLTREEVLGKNVWEMFPQHVGSVFYQKYHEAMREQKTVKFEARSPVTSKWLELNAYPSEQGLSVYYRDISERKRAEEQLAYHAYLLENVHDAVIATDEGLAVTAWNKGAERMYGWRADETLGRNIWEVVPVDMSEQQRAEALRELEEKGRFRTEAVTYRKDGTPVYVEGITIALRGEQEEGQITGYVNIRRDITERKRAEEALRESNRRIENILESISDEFYAVDREWRYTYINERALAAIREAKGEELTREEILGKSMWEIFPEVVGSIFYEKYHEALREQKTVHCEGYSPLTARWVEVHVYPSKAGLSLYSGDISERKRAEEKLRRSEAFLAQAQALSHTGSWSWNVSTGELFWSEEHYRICGLDPEGGPPFYPSALEYIHTADRSFVQDSLERAVREKSDFDQECRIIRPDGTIRHIHGLAHPVFDESGDLIEYVGTIIDITERRQGEQTLQDNQQRLRVALESSPVAFTIMRAARDESSQITDFEWLYLNPVASRILGRASEELIGRRVRHVLPDAWEPRELFESFVQVVSTGEPRDIEVLSRRDGIDEWFHNIAAKLGDGIAVWFTDVTERKRAEEQLRRSEAFLAEGQKISHTGTWAVKFPSEEVFWSQEMYRIYCLDPATTKLSRQMAFQLIHPEDRSSVRGAFDRAVRDKSDYALEHRAIMADGSVKHLHALGRPVLNESGELIEYIGTVMDVTEPKRSEAAMEKLQTEVAHAARMAMMGELAASIAHEINQPLGALVNNGNVAMRLAKAAGTTSDRLLEVLSDIVSDADRASAIIARIRSVMSKTAPEKTSLQLKDLVLDILPLAQRELTARRIEVRLEFPEDLPSVSGDRVRLQEVFLNLVMNGIDAMSAVEGERRILTIRGKREELDGKAAVLIAVQDLGAGFKPEDNDRLFEAFYTTKPDGLGMGLRISRSIVELHGGRLWGSSNEGQGATFYCALPAE